MEYPSDTTTCDNQEKYSENPSSDLEDDDIIISVAQDLDSNVNEYLFRLSTGKADEEIAKSKIVVAKGKRGAVGLRGYGIHYTMATTKLAQVCDAPTHFESPINQ